MKTTITTVAFSISFCVIAGMLIGGCGHKYGEPFTGPINSFKRYPMEKFHLTYEYSGDVMGTEELFVAGYGKYETRYSKLNVYSPEGVKPDENGSVMRLFDVTSIDFLSRRGSHRTYPYLDSLYHLSQSDVPPAQQYLEAEMKKNYCKFIGMDTLDGKSVARWQQTDGDMTLWIWNNILLRKRAASEKGSLDMRIKTIDSLWKVDSAVFTVPKGITVMDESQMPHASSSD